MQARDIAQHLSNIAFGPQMQMLEEFQTFFRPAACMACAVQDCDNTICKSCWKRCFACDKNFCHNHVSSNHISNICDACFTQFKKIKLE